MHTQRRYATCLGMSKKRTDSPLSKKKKKERWFIQRGSYTIHQKYTHTCTSWSRFMTCFSIGSSFWLSKIWEAGMPSILHTYSSTKIAIRDRLRKKGIIKSLGDELYTLSDLRDHSRNFINFFWKTFTKPPDWRLNWRERNMSTLWYRSDSQPPCFAEGRAKG